MRIRAEPAKAFSARQECDVLRAAVAHDPRSAALRLRLAKLLNQLDAFDETIALLTGADIGTLDHSAWLTLAAAYFARDDDAPSADALARALALARTGGERSVALTEQAKLLLRAGERDAGRARLDEALRLEPANALACRRLTTDLIRCGEVEAAVALTDRLAAQGINHAELLTMRTLALARLGRIDEARAIVDPGGFRHVEMLSPPPAWHSLADFNAALVEELEAHPGMRYERHGTASQKTWRIDALATGASPLARALLTQIVEAAERHAASLTDRTHPWISARPAAGTLRSWCVITEGDGFERWHTHPAGWMSGVYYAQVPSSVSQGDDAGGCIAFGIPDKLAGATAAGRFGEQLVRPQAGLLMLFPSHGHHRTFPHGAVDRRICVSFDILPDG